MKIRTDFVTNSSSYCTTEIIIDNSVLLEILRKYKDMGLFGQNDPIIGIGVYETTDGKSWVDDHQNYTNTPAFYYYEEQNDEGIKCLNLIDGICPYSLGQVLEYIISIIDAAGKYLDVQIRAKLEEELDQIKDEINRVYSRVYWRSSTSGDSGDFDAKFEFDPINGSSYVYKSDEDAPTTEIAIDNPLLLEILQKYKGMGLFGDRDPIIGIGVFHSTDWHWDEYLSPELSGVPAFYYYEREGVYNDESLKLARFCPQKLVYVLKALILIMENGVDYLDEQILARMKEELTQKTDEINQAYSRVYWSYLNGTVELTRRRDEINQPYPRVWWSYLNGTERVVFDYDLINGESYSGGEDGH